MKTFRFALLISLLSSFAVRAQVKVIALADTTKYDISPAKLDAGYIQFNKLSEGMTTE